VVSANIELNKIPKSKRTLGKRSRSQVFMV